MAVKATGATGTGNSNTSIVPLSPTELENIQKKIAEFVKDGAIFFGNGCDNGLDFMLSSYPCSIEYRRDRYTNATAAVEAQKFTSDLSVMYQFTKLDADAAGVLSWEKRGSQIRINEEPVKEAVFSTKFSQNPDLKKLLLSTGGAYIAFSNYSYDTDWSDGFNCTGKNKFGSILMQVRGQLGGKGEVKKPDDLLRIKEKQLGAKFNSLSNY